MSAEMLVLSWDVECTGVTLNHHNELLSSDFSTSSIPRLTHNSWHLEQGLENLKNKSFASSELNMSIIDCIKELSSQFSGSCSALACKASEEVCVRYEDVEC